MKVVVYGPPGFQWKLLSMKDTIEDLQCSVAEMRLCHFQEKYDKKNALRSGSYRQVLTNLQLQATDSRPCLGLIWEEPGACIMEQKVYPL